MSNPTTRMSRVENKISIHLRFNSKAGKFVSINFPTYKDIRLLSFNHGDLLWLRHNTDIILSEKSFEDSDYFKWGSAKVLRNTDTGTKSTSIGG